MRIQQATLELASYTFYKLIKLKSEVKELVQENGEVH